MIYERTIETSEDGTAYATDAITIFYRDASETKNTIFYIDPNVMYSLIIDYMRKLSLGEKQQEEDTEKAALKKRVSALMRAGIKAGLLLWGNDLLTLLYGSKNHPKMEKKADVLEWYFDQFTRVGLAHMMRNDTIVYGKIVKEDGTHTIINVAGLYTRPVTIAVQNNEDSNH
jgi:hypothetical protein